MNDECATRMDVLFGFSCVKQEQLVKFEGGDGSGGVFWSGAGFSPRPCGGFSWISCGSFGFPIYH